MRLSYTTGLVLGLFVFSYSDQSGQDARVFARKGDFSLAKGDVAGALEAFEEAHAAAERTGDSAYSRLLLNNVGATQLGSFRYKDAGQTLLKVRESAEKAQDYSILASASGNLAALLTQSNDLAAAENYARESLDAYARAGQASYKAELNLANIVRRRLSGEKKPLNWESEKYFRQGIESAERAGDWFLASEGWLFYGQGLMEAGRIVEAEHAFSESLRLRRQRNLRGEETCLRWLSRLRLKQDKNREALALADLAIAASQKSSSRVPFWMLIESRAEAELALGEERKALVDSRRAIEEARISRADEIPEDNQRIGYETFFELAYSTLIDAGNVLYQKSKDPALLRETFEVQEEDRAGTLEELLPGFQNWRKRLPEPQYHHTLAALARARGRLFQAPSPGRKDESIRIQARLSEMERAAGSPSRPENSSILDNLRRNLPPDSAVLSFHLGDKKSWLWAVDERGLRLRELPAKASIEAKIGNFQRAIRENDSAAIAALGNELFRDLFGEPGQSYRSAKHWYLSIEEQLYSLSFPALVVEFREGKPVYLTQQKSLQVIAGAKLFKHPQSLDLRTGGLLFAGDGVYNLADPRYRKPGLVRPASWTMPRLNGSGEEVRYAAGLRPNATLLIGPHLTRETLLQGIDRDPAIIHIASHAVEGRNRWHSAVLALGINRRGTPDLLTSEEIVTHPVQSRLVVMTGCSSGAAQSVPVSGLIGLTRSWLAAGAGAVLATRWPTRDEAGDGLIGRFYAHLLASAKGDVAGSLQSARIEMIARGGWRAEPRYWDSFFLIGNR